MRRVSTSVWMGGALLALLAIILIAPVVNADEPPDPPGIRILPPGGLTAQGQVRTHPPIGVATEEAGRIHPPVGVAAQVRIGPPGGIAAQPEAPSLIDRFWEWLQVRIGPPIP